MFCQPEYLCHQRKQEKWPEWALLGHTGCTGRRAVLSPRPFPVCPQLREKGKVKNHMWWPAGSWNMVLCQSSLICCRININKQYGTILHAVSVLVGFNFKKYLNFVAWLYVLNWLNNKNERNWTTIFYSLSHNPSPCHASVGSLVWLSLGGLVLHFTLTLTFSSHDLLHLYKMYHMLCLFPNCHSSSKLPPD